LGDAVDDVIRLERPAFVRADGGLDVDRLLDAFGAFWREQGEILTEDDDYGETTSHLVIMAFLHRVADAGGHVTREAAVGLGRVDVLIRWPYQSVDGRRAWQVEAIEIKAWRRGRRDPLGLALVQLDTYLARLDLDHGHAVIFDQRPSAAPIEARVRLETHETPNGRQVTVLRA
jgi:hypothetical protein